MALQFDDGTRRFVVLFVLGLALLTGAVFVGTSDRTHTYSHDASVETEPLESDEPLMEERVAFDSLSPEAQDIFVEAVESDGTVWTSGPVGDQFEYPPGTAGAERYYVEYGGETYLLTTKNEDRFAAVLSRTTAVGAGISGLVLAVAALLPTIGRRAPASLSRLARTAESILPLSAVALLWFTLVSLALTPLLGGLVFLFVIDFPANVASVVLGYGIAVGVVALSIAGVLRFLHVTPGTFVGTLLPVTVFWAFLFVSVAGDVLASGESYIWGVIVSVFGVAIVVPGFGLGWWLRSRRNIL